MDDAFDELANLNQKSYEEGYEEGRKDGEKEAYESGYEMGKKMALAVGKELGEYYRLSRSFESSTNQHDTLESTPDKSGKLARQIIDLIDRFDFEDCHNEQFEAKFNTIRDKFKQLCSLTNTRSSFNSPKNNNENLASFKLSNNPKLSF